MTKSIHHQKVDIPPLTRPRERASFGAPLPDGVMVAQATLTRLVMVRIHVGQPGLTLALLAYLE